MLDELEAEHQDMALDVVEQCVLGADWACERTAEGVIHCATTTRWGECAGMFVWRDEPPHARVMVISDLLRRINERLWLGHFDYWADDGVVAFRHTLPMLERAAPDPGEVASVLAAALDACDQYLPAFNFVVWAGKSPEEAMNAVVFETVGEA
jgi:hypothetical protein